MNKHKPIIDVNVYFILFIQVTLDIIVSCYLCGDINMNPCYVRLDRYESNDDCIKFIINFILEIIWPIHFVHQLFGI